MIDQQIKPSKPNIITNPIEFAVFDDYTDIDSVVEALLSGKYVLISQFYHFGLKILRRLKQRLMVKYKRKNYLEEKQYRAEYRKYSHNLLIEVISHSIHLEGAPRIGWLQILYPDTADFFIAFPDIQGLNSSWQWFKRGIKFQPLNFRIHPYYDVYFPTRDDHINLFDSWLSQYSGSKDIAIDVGIGSGVLSHILLKHDFSKVLGTDVNPNAIIGMRKEKLRLGINNELQLHHGDLFEGVNHKADLIVFNPPWIKSDREMEKGIDKAIYFQNGLFSRFFEQASDYMNIEGQLAIIFSNLGNVTGSMTEHPIEREINEHDRFKKIDLFKHRVKPGSKLSGRKNWRQKELVELWILTQY